MASGHVTTIAQWIMHQESLQPKSAESMYFPSPLALKILGKDGQVSNVLGLIGFIDIYNIFTGYIV